MTKVLQINMPDGSRWQAPIQPIAENRAHYFAERYARAHMGAGYDHRYAIELRESLADSRALIEWATNHMDWQGINAVQTGSPSTINYEDEWYNSAHKLVIDTDDII